MARYYVKKEEKTNTRIPLKLCIEVSKYPTDIYKNSINNYVVPICMVLLFCVYHRSPRIGRGSVLLRIFIII